MWGFLGYGLWLDNANEGSFLVGFVLTMLHCEVNFVIGVYSCVWA